MSKSVAPFAMRKVIKAGHLEIKETQEIRQSIKNLSMRSQKDDAKGRTFMGVHPV